MPIILPIKSFAAGLVAALLLVCPIPPAGAGETSDRPRPPRPWKTQAALSVNRSMDYRQVVRQTEAAGISQMRALAAAPTLEEIWAFVPAEGLWIELGCCERADRHHNYSAMEGYVHNLMAAYDDLAMYHIHPKTAFVRETYGDRQKLAKTVEEGLPSADDMRAMWVLSKQFRQLHPRGRLAWRIVSRHGVTEYGLTAQGVAQDREPDTSPFLYGVLDDEDLEESGALLDPDSPSAGVDDLIVKACRELSRNGFLVEFRPWRKMPGR